MLKCTSLPGLVTISVELRMHSKHRVARPYSCRHVMLLYKFSVKENLGRLSHAAKDNIGVLG
jgi:hypothetical protein